MRKAFLIGKFLPFHNGHKAMILFALEHCDFLTVLVCCSDKENIEGNIRQKWITDTFSEMQKMEVQVFDYQEDMLPNTSVSSRDVSKVWAEILKQKFPDYSLLVSSEPYGDYLAEYMNIQHIPFDFDRQKYPVSASAIRANLMQNWSFLPPSVKPFFATKVVILGTESTGKTTLCNQLAAFFNCNLVSEVGRDIVEDSKDFDFNDLEIIAKKHAEQIENEIIKDKFLTIIDTDIHITMSYANFVFGKKLTVEDSILAKNKAQLYLYLCNDVPYQQDGTRLEEIDRNRLDISHRKTLAEHHINFIEICGNWQQRFDKAVEAIQDLINNL